MKKLHKNKLKMEVKLNHYHEVKNKPTTKVSINFAKYAMKPKQIFPNHIKSFMTTYNNTDYLYIKEHDDLFENNILDLHGYCQAASRALIHIFFKYATKNAFENITIITGPGPILKNFIYQLITQPKFQKHIKNIQSMEGAYNIKLK